MACKKTLSFPKGKGSLAHNNREFIADNIDQTRTYLNRIYIQEPLPSAYEECFGEAVRVYNAKQKRKDRIKKDYLNEIKNSGNNQKVFYENIVQIGTKKDTPVVDENGNITEDALIAVEILEEYVKTFLKRNPNLYLFNAVLHMDESTPHLHLDYIPVAHGYKRGLETQNSLSRALQQQGIPKATSKMKNETVFWENREREYLTELCQKRGIEIEVLGVKRDNYSLPEYKEAMRAVEALEEQAQVLDERNQVLEHQLEKYELEEKTKKVIEHEVNALVGKTKSEAIPVNSFIKKDKEKYVKVPLKKWNEIIKAYKWAKSKEKEVQRLQKQVVNLTNTVDQLKLMIGRYKTFLSVEGLLEKFEAFIHPKKESLITRLNRQKELIRGEKKQEIIKDNKKRDRGNMDI